MLNSHPRMDEGHQSMTMIKYNDNENKIYYSFAFSDWVVSFCSTYLLLFNWPLKLLDLSSRELILKAAWRPLLPDRLPPLFAIKMAFIFLEASLISIYYFLFIC